MVRYFRILAQGTDTQNRRGAADLNNPLQGDIKKTEADKKTTVPHSLLLYIKDRTTEDLFNGQTKARSDTGR